MTGISTSDYDIVVQVRKDSYGKISSGLVLADILPQNQALILEMHKGELKENPSVGVGISDMLLDNDLQAWKSRIREQMEMDGQTVEGIAISRYSMSIDSYYA